jgi:AcrR family transcriptional regulator
MEPDARSEIVSRRNRPAKAPLSREVIVAAALGILEREGAAGLSLRRVAAALDTGAASLYVYLSNLDELHALMLDAALGAVKLPEARALPWRARLRALLLSYLLVLHERRGLAQLALATTACGPNALRIWERLMGLLKEGGVDDLKAAWGVDLLTLYVTSIAAEQNIRRESGQGLERVQKALAAVAAEEFPLLFAAKSALLSGGGRSRAEWALDVIIEGIVGGRPPAAVPRTSAKRRRR